MKSVAMPRRPQLLKLPQSNGSAFILKGDSIAWNNPWHFHPEIELLYCIKGRGTNFVGNSIAPIEEGEILLFGRNLPHTRQRNKEYYNQNPEENPETIVIQFREDFLGETLFSISEFRHIGNLLQEAQRGITFVNSTRKQIAEQLTALKSCSGSHAILRLLDILDTLARSNEYRYLNNARYSQELNSKDTQKLNAVLKYVHEHFQEHISLAQVADVANLSAAAFCRYFKSRTRKSFVEYLNQTRVDYACGLLMEGCLDVTQISFASGFNNLSNFNKQFRKFSGETPSQYRNKALQKQFNGLPGKLAQLEAHP